MSEPISAADIFKGRARKYNHYEEGEKVEGRSCNTCVRRTFSYPYNCDDGWPLLSQGPWRDRGPTCINWSDDKRCPVD